MEKNEQLKAFLSGGIGGICLTLVGHPFDLIKVKLQTSHNNDIKITNIIKNIVKNDGARGLYRGMASPLVGAIPICALSFWGFEIGLQLYSRAQKKIENYEEKKEKEKEERKEERKEMIKKGVVGGGLAAVLFGGFFSSFPAALGIVPMERVKILVQGQTNPQKQALTPMTCTKNIIKTEGIRGLYKGSFVTILRDGPGYLAYFGMYEMIRSAWPRSPNHDNSKKNVAECLVAGGCAGVMAWLICLPADTVKSRYQLQTGASKIGIGHITVDLWKKEGIPGFYKGLGPAIMRAFPGNAACFLGMEMTRSFLDSYF